MDTPNAGPKALFWFRRDLRLHDNCGLHHALRETGSVLPVFIFDRHILDGLDEKDDPRVTFIYRQVEALQRQLREWGSDLLVCYGYPAQVFQDLAQQFPGLEAVYANRDYEPYAKARDAEAEQAMAPTGIRFRAYKDQVMFEGREILSGSGNPFTVYSPYARRWRERLPDNESFPISPKGFFQTDKGLPMPTLRNMGFEESPLRFPSSDIGADLLRHYADRRDLPSRDATSHASVHLRFGTVSIREVVALARRHSDKWLAELIWRDFNMQLLDNHPRIVYEAFRREYDRIPWRNNEDEFAAWCEGRTGYPLVDAGMRQLNQERWMHNRARLVTAAFLCKHLLIDWRWGEAWFAGKLIDYDQANNVNNWQWSAGSGADANPYFRVLNPQAQQEKFDPEFEYVRRYVPEFGTDRYPRPIVEHEFARKRALDVIGKAVKK